jgi:hypothetical protein
VRKYNKGVVTSADFAPWVRPKPQSGLIVGERWIPLEDLPAASVAPEDQGEAGGCAPEASLPHVPAASSRVRRGRGYNSGAVTSADCGPWVPPKPQGGLIVEGRWIDRPRSSPPEDAGAAAGATRNVASAGAETINWRIIA